MLYIILAIFLIALCTPYLHSRLKRASLSIYILFTVLPIAYFIGQLSSVVQGKTLVETHAWIPSMQINLVFFLDGLSLFFALLISILGLLIVVYAWKYLDESKKGRFYAYLLFFMGSMLGVVLSSNLISLFVFWELTSLSSFLLIGFKNQSERSRYAARQALLITAGGGLALLAGFILIYILTGSYDLAVILNQSEIIQTSGLVNSVVILILLGAFTKSAQFPFYFWLPNAMEAPTPVSAYLHSATMVKAGVYLVFRLNPVFSGIEIWHDLLMIVAGFTMVFAATKALLSDDIKRILAFTTISALSIFFFMIGVGTKEAIGAAIVYVMAHALYKGAFFLIAGNLDHETGTRKVSELSGMGKKMPLTAAATILAGLSMAGFLPFAGFVGKEALYEALIHDSWFNLVLVFFAGVVYVLVAIEIAYNVFFAGITKPINRKIHEAPPAMTYPVLFLGILGFLFGTFPGFFAQPLLSIASNNMMGQPTEMVLKLWHGFNEVFLLSITTLIAGVVIYIFRQKIRAFRNRQSWSRHFSSDTFYNAFLNGTNNLAVAQTKFIQNGYLRNYISIYLTIFIGLVFYIFWDRQLYQQIFSQVQLNQVGLFEISILFLILTGIFILFRTRSRLVVVATLSILGYGVALGYTLFSAPDVAMTQFLAETLTLILLILILHRLPKYVISDKVNVKYLLVSIVFGVLMTGISFMMLNQQFGSSLKEYFLQAAIPEGKGQNVVNVILVDFRALDTLGEITVLGITMIGILSLLKLRPKKARI